MTPVSHPSNNIILRAAPGDGERVMDIPVTVVQYPDGLSAIREYWLPNAAELALLNAGHAVRLEIVTSTNVPPVLLGVAGDGETDE